MDLLGTASALATVVGLLGQFKSSKDAAQGKDFNEFMAWLIESGHQELKSLIEANHTTTIGIKAVLNQQNADLAEILSRIDSVIASFASTLSGFSDISAGLKPESLLSNQALSILQQFESSGASKAVEQKFYSGAVLHPLDGQSGSFELSDQRFLEDDLRGLLRIGLLELTQNSKGDRVFHYTRAASALIKARG